MHGPHSMPPHANHTASLPVFIAEVFPTLTVPIIIQAIPDVLNALRRVVFNGDIWPDFARIPLLNGIAPALKFFPAQPGTPALIGNLQVTPIRINHVVPTVGFLVEGQGAGFAITSDTFMTDENMDSRQFNAPFTGRRPEETHTRRSG